jgi:hypothetical protein
VISPVPVTLKRFLALEFVFTFGIINNLSITPCWRHFTGSTLVEPCGKLVGKGMAQQLIFKAFKEVLLSQHLVFMASPVVSLTCTFRTWLINEP